MNIKNLIASVKKNAAPIIAVLVIWTFVVIGWKQNNPPHEHQRDWAGPGGENVCSICGAKMTNLVENRKK